MLDTIKPSPTHVRWRNSGRFTDLGAFACEIGDVIGVGRRVSMDTWYHAPASIAA